MPLIKTKAAISLRVLEVLLWISGLGLALVFLAVVALQLAPVQQFLADRVTGYLSDKLQTKVKVGRFTTDWSNSLVLKDFYLEDRQHDTLLYAGRLGLDVNMLALLRNKIILKSARIDDGVLNIRYSQPDTVSNFAFIREGFTGKASGAGDTVTTFLFRVGDVRLNRVKLYLNDEARGNFVKADLGRFSATMQKFDPAKKKYQIRKAALAESRISITRTRPGGNKDRPLPDGIGFKKIAFEDVFFKYHHKVTGQQLTLQIGKSELAAKEIGVADKVLRLDEISFANSSLYYLQPGTGQPDTLQARQEAAGAAARGTLANLGQWTFSLKKLQLKNVILAVAGQAKKGKPTGFDLNNTRLSGLHLNLQNLAYGGQQLKADLRQLSFTEKSGWQLVKGKGSVKGTPGNFEIRNLDLRTKYSRLQSAISVSLPKASRPGKRLAGATFSADIKKATINPADLAFFSGDLAGNPIFQKFRKHPVRLKGKLSGQLHNIKVRQIEISGLDGSSLTFSGSIRNLTAKTGRQLKVQVQDFTTTRQDLKTLLPAGSLPETLTLPENIKVTGGLASVPGNLILSNLSIKASDGSEVLVNGFVHGQEGVDKRLDLQVKKLVTSRKALVNMLPKGALAPEIKLPDNISFTGRIRGPSLKHFNSDGAFETSYGNFQAVFNLRPGQQFSGSLDVQNFNVGKLLSLYPDLSTATGKGNFNGAGFKINTMVLHFDARIKKITYKKEHFRNVEVTGTLDKSAYSVDGNIRNIVFQGLGHKLKVIKKLKPKGLGVRKIFGKKKD